VYIVGLLIAFTLIGLGVGTIDRQRRTARRLREERFLPSDDRAYLRGQVVRRSLVAVVLVAIGGMIGGYYLSGMDNRANQIADRKKGADPADDPGRPPDPNPADEKDKEFAKFLGIYFIAILVLVFVVACLAVLDFGTTRRYWMAQYKRIKEDHETKLRRDLAVYRQQKDNERLGRRGDKEPDNPDDTDPNGEPPVV
jgi:hypothetical protein